MTTGQYASHGFKVYTNEPKDYNKDLEILIAETEREIEVDTCLDDDELILDTELYYNETVSKKRSYYD